MASILKASSAAILIACGAAQAAPKLIVTPVNDDLSGNGNIVAGFAYDGALEHYVPIIWRRGAGSTIVSGAYGADGGVHVSDDGATIAATTNNIENWGDLNCFAGYCWRPDAGCTLGDPLLPPHPCQMPSVAHWWNESTGWVNTGSFTRFRDQATGRYFGGTRCDQTINTVNAMSDNGRILIGGGYSAQLLSGSGGPGFGLCGDFYGFAYDTATRAFMQLPVQPGTRTARADRVNADGTVITGYDYGVGNDGYAIRRICVWVNGAQTILDNMTDQSKIYPVNRTGTVIAGQPGSTFLATLGTSGKKLVRWMRQGNGTWLPQNLGRPVDRVSEDTIEPLVSIYVNGISDDGNTIIGTAAYSAEGPSGNYRPYIWNAGINGGVPLDLQDYLDQINGAPFFEEGMRLAGVSNISGDANALQIQAWDFRNRCTNGAQSLQTMVRGVLWMNGSAIACEPPAIAIQPRGWTSTPNAQYGLGAAVNVFASGSWPLNYQWQREDPWQPGHWMDLTDDCSDFSRTLDWNYEGTHTMQLRVGDNFEGLGRSGRYRVVVSNSCGSVTSAPAEVRILQNCAMIADDFAVAATCSGGGQTCSTIVTKNVETTGLLAAEYIAPESACGRVGMNFLVDGNLVMTTPTVGAGEATGELDLGWQTPGIHVVGMQAYGEAGGCNTGTLTSWSGTLRVRRSSDQPTVTLPATMTMCRTGETHIAATTTGAGPFTCQWQREIQAGVYAPLTDGATGSGSTISGSTAHELVIAAGGDSDRGNYRCIVTNSCDRLISDPVALTLCIADFNCDNAVDFFDYLDFVDGFASMQPSSDFNRDGVIDFFDYLDFVDAFSVGC